MIAYFDREKIRQVEEDIIREISGKTGTAYILPFKFSKPISKKNSTYRVLMDAIKINGQYYPPEIFMCVSDWWEKPVIIVHPPYDSLAHCHILPDDGGWTFGFDLEEGCGENIHDLTKKIPIDIDVKRKTYKIVEEFENAKQSQPGDN